RPATHLNHFRSLLIKSPVVAQLKLTSGGCGMAESTHARRLKKRGQSSTRPNVLADIERALHSTAPPRDADEYSPGACGGRSGYAIAPVAPCTSNQHLAGNKGSPDALRMPNRFHVSACLGFGQAEHIAPISVEERRDPIVRDAVN